MPTLSFTTNLRRHVGAPTCSVDGETVRDCLAAAFTLHPALEGYVVDEHGALRPHMAIFVNDQPIIDRRTLTDSVAAGDALFVAQALSGG